MTAPQLWRVIGFGRSGGRCTLKVRAVDYTAAIQRAAFLGCVRIESVCLVTL